jgi:transposase InsO family protein
MSKENPLWGAPRIHGELLKLGFEIAQSTVSKYMIRHRGPPSQTWRTFLRNHADAIAAIDLCVVPTVTFECLFAFLVVGHGRRQLLWFAVTRHPTAEWLAQQIMEAFPWDTAPTYLVRDNDGTYGQAFTSRVRAMGIRDRPISPRSPWQNPYIERLIGTLRRDCLDHVLIYGERHLRRMLTLYSRYYNETRTHLGLGKDAPLRRAVERSGTITTIPILSGLHHRYARIWFSGRTGRARKFFLSEVHALKPHNLWRGSSPYAGRQDKHTRAETLPVLVHGCRSPLPPDFLAQLHRCKDISARRAEEHRQFVNVWADRPDQLRCFVRHSFADATLDLDAADVGIPVQVVNIRAALHGLLVDKWLRSEGRKEGQAHCAYRAYPYASQKALHV